MDYPKRVLFVCMGNICRSPAAEGVFKQFIANRNLSEKIFFDSAGTHDYHVGSAPDPRMHRAALRRGYNLTHSARLFDGRDFEDFDLVVAMDRSNLRNMLQKASSSIHRLRAKLLSDFLPPGTPPDIPDPYYGNEDGFEIVLDLLEQAREPLLKHLLRQKTKY